MSKVNEGRWPLNCQRKEEAPLVEPRRSQECLRPVIEPEDREGLAMQGRKRETLLRQEEIR